MGSAPEMKMEQDLSAEETQHSLSGTLPGENTQDVDLARAHFHPHSKSLS